jgi:hypothetical protein
MKRYGWTPIMQERRMFLEYCGILGIEQGDGTVVEQSLIKLPSKKSGRKE